MSENSEGKSEHNEAAMTKVPPGKRLQSSSLKGRSKGSGSRGNSPKPVTEGAAVSELEGDMNKLDVADSTKEGGHISRPPKHDRSVSSSSDTSSDLGKKVPSGSSSPSQRKLSSATKANRPQSRSPSLNSMTKRKNDLDKDVVNERRMWK